MMNEIEQLARYYFQHRHWKKVLEVCRANGYQQGYSSHIDFFAGVSLFNLGSIDQAQTLFTGILQKTPSNHEAGIFLARCHLTKLENHHAYRVVMSHISGLEDPNLLDMAATILSHVGMPHLALPILQKARGVQPSSSNMISNEAICTLHLGDLPRARGLFEELLKLEPDNQRACWQLAKISKAKDYRLIEHMQESMRKRNLSPENSIFYNYAIGKQFEDLQEWDRAFSHYDQAAAAVKQHLNYDVNRDIELTRAISEETMEKPPSPTHTSNRTDEDSDRLIFITGLPRSGTSLIDQIVSAHSEVHSAGELQAVEYAIKRVCGAATNQPVTANEFSKALSHSSEFAAVYREATDYLRHDQKWLVDKMPNNYLYLGLLAKAFPQAKLVLVERNPIDACFAMFKQLFASKYQFTYSLEDLGRYYIAYSKLIKHWKASIGDRLVQVSYEDLVCDPESQISRLLENLGLPFESSCLRPHEQRRSVMTASSHQVREKIYSSSVGKHTKFQRHLAPLFELFKRNEINTK